MKKTKIKSLDLFAGCGGLMEGFEQSGYYETIAAVEWEKAQCINLIKRLKNKWGYNDAENRVLRFDIQRTDELFNGWKDKEYGDSTGLDRLINAANGLDIIIGGPPCQAYSVAGRVRDENGMKNDYRNFLFESYIKVVKKYKPKVFVFENVPGILSASPTGKPIINIIQQAFKEAGYLVVDDMKKAIIDFSEYGVPQNRKRIIILGLKIDFFGAKSLDLINNFYSEILPKYKVKRKVSVREAIGDLEKLYPLENPIQMNGKKYSHSLPKNGIPNHIPRWHNTRDQMIFKLLCDDISSGQNKYISTQTLKDLYEKMTGHKSNVHKYHVIRWDTQSNLIPAHLYKDGLRHIHPDGAQARSLTVREAARLQGFPDDYIFEGTSADAYKMIGNAVPPIFSKILAEAIYDYIFKRGG